MMLAIVHTAMLEKPPIFNGQHRLNKAGRNLVVRNQAALGAVRVFAQASDEQRLELVTPESLAAVVHDRIDHAIPGVNGCGIGRVVRLRAGVHRDRQPRLGKSPHPRWARVAIGGVAGLAQFIGDQALAQLLSQPHLAGRRIDLRGVGEERLLQPLINDVSVLAVVVPEDDQTNQADEQNAPDHTAHQPR